MGAEVPDARCRHALAVLRASESTVSSDLGKRALVRREPSGIAPDQWGSWANSPPAWLALLCLLAVRSPPLRFPSTPLAPLQLCYCCCCNVSREPTVSAPLSQLCLPLLFPFKALLVRKTLRPRSQPPLGHNLLVAHHFA